MNKESIPQPVFVSLTTKENDFLKRLIKRDDSYFQINAFVNIQNAMYGTIRNAGVMHQT